MAPVALSANTQSFLDTYIHDIEWLDVLLNLRSHGGKFRDVVDVARDTGIEPIRAGQHLVRLSLEGLIERAPRCGPIGSYRYVTRPKKEECLRELEQVFSKERLSVVEYLFQRQRRQFQSFADALRGEPK